MKIATAFLLLMACSSERRAPATSAKEPTETACDHITVLGDQDGLWIGAPPDLKCFAPRKAGAVDLAWFASELRTLTAALDSTCVPLVELFGFRGDDAELAALQDVLNKAGLTDRSVMLDSASTTNPLDVVKQFTTPAPGHCPKPVRAGPVHPIAVITATAISVVANGRTVPISNVADVEPTTDTLPALAAALGTPTFDKSFVIQAESATPAPIINRVVTTARQAGFARMVIMLDIK